MTATFLAIEPGTREIGCALFRDGVLAECRVRSLRRVHSKRSRTDLLGHTVLQLIEKYHVEVIAIGRTDEARIGNVAAWNRRASTIRELAKRKNIPVFEIGSTTTKAIVAGEATATKRMVARAVCDRYSYLKPHLANVSKLQERYRLRMFDAIALGMAYHELAKDHQLHRYAIA